MSAKSSGQHLERLKNRLSWLEDLKEPKLHHLEEMSTLRWAIIHLEVERRDRLLCRIETLKSELATCQQLLSDPTVHSPIVEQTC